MEKLPKWEGPHESTRPWQGQESNMQMPGSWVKPAMTSHGWAGIGKSTRPWGITPNNFQPWGGAARYTRPWVQPYMQQSGKIQV